MPLSREKQIKIGAVLSYAVIGFNIVVGLLYTPWMVSRIGRDNYGLYTLVTTFLNYFVVDFGIWMAVNKVLSSMRAKGDADGERRVIGVATKIYLGLDVLVCIAVCVAYFFIDQLFGNSLSPENLQSFKAVYRIAAVFGVLSFPFGFVKGVYNAYEFFTEIKILDFVVKTGIIFFTIAALLMGGGLIALVFVYGCVPFVVNIVRVLYLRRKGVRADLRGFHRGSAKEILNLSAWLFLFVLAELFINNFAPTLITIFSSIGEVAVFGIAVTIYGYVYNMCQALSGLFLPKVAEMHEKGAYQGIMDLAIKVGRIQLLVVGFVVLAFALAGRDFVLAWMGPSFSRSYIVAILLILPQFIVNIQQIEATYLLVIDKIKYRTALMLANAAISIVLSVIFIPRYGACGAAMAIGAANMLTMVVGQNIVYKIFLKISFKKIFKGYAPLALSFTAVSAAYEAVSRCLLNFDGSAWTVFAAKAAVLVALSVLALPLMLNKYEKRELSKFVLKLKK